MNFHFFPCRRLCVLLAFAMSIHPIISRVARGDATHSSNAPFAGTFSDEKLTISLSEAGGGFVGTITLGGDSFPVKAAATGQELSGTFIASGAEFSFAASFADGRLILISGGKTHSLARTVTNPLVRNGGDAARSGQYEVRPSPAPAGNAPVGDVQSFGSFSVLGATQTGKTLFIKLPTAQSLESALTQTADELGRMFDAKPELSGAFAEAKAKNKGGVSLAAKLKGHDIHGVIFAGIGQNGGSATVIFATADASKEDLAALYAAMPAAPIKMTTHKFPDGSGSIDLPDGWTTPDPTAAHGLGVVGPAGQRIAWNSGRMIMDPNGSMVRMGRQTYQVQLQNYRFAMNQYQQLLAAHQRNPNSPVGQPPTAPVEPNADPNIQYPGVVFCRECEGEEDVLKYLNPVLEQKQRLGGKGYSTVDKVFAVFPGEPNPYIAGSKSGTAYIAATDHVGDTITHIRAVTQTTTSPLIKGESWQISATSMRAPDETFDRDLPVMSAIVNSIVLDMDVVNQVQARDGGAIRKIFADKFKVMVKAGQDFQDQQAASFASHEEQIAAQEQARHDSSSDFIEYITGIRHVYDTRTGKTLDVDLFHSDAITGGLNAMANDPNAFVQIPLRYLR